MCTTVLIQSTSRASAPPAQPIVREAELATAGCDLASYGFEPPASAVIAGTNAASIHAIPNAMIVTFDMTRTRKIFDMTCTHYPNIKNGRPEVLISDA